MGKEEVTKLIDGDTILTSRRTKPVRLANVNTPEKGEKSPVLSLQSTVYD